MGRDQREKVTARSPFPSSSSDTSTSGDADSVSFSSSSSSSSSSGGKRRALGRSALLSASSTRPPPAKGYYHPVSVDANQPHAPPAVPGQCVVQESWLLLSSAPVAYQMQKMMEAQEDPYEEEMESQGAVSRNQSSTQPLMLQPHTTATAATTSRHQEGGGAATGSEQGLWEPCVWGMTPDFSSDVEFPELTLRRSARR